MRYAYKDGVAVSPRSLSDVPKVIDLLERLPLLRTWRLLHADDPEYPHRSFIVEFAGMPKAGKSSAIENVRHFFSHSHGTRRWKNKEEWISLRYEVHTPAEGVSLRTPAILRDNRIDFNAWAGAYGLQELIRAGHDGFNDMAVLDRGPWDAGCWLRLWSSTDATDDELDSLVSFFHLKKWMTRADLHVVLLVDPDHAATREREHRLIEHGGFSSNEAKMSALRAIYEDKFQALRAVKNAACPEVKDRSTLMLDTSEHSSTEAAAVIIDAILNVLEAKVEVRAKNLKRSPTELKNRLDNYWRRMKPEARRAANDFLKESFVPTLNSLEPWRRLVLINRLEQLAMPEAIAEARVPADEVINTLRTELQEVQTL